jgi:hypothetical protein
LLEVALAHLRKSSARQFSEAYLRARVHEIGMTFSQAEVNASTGAVG